MGFWSQLLLLSWKNFILRRRQKLRFVAEIVFPLTLFIILVMVRTRPDLKIRNTQCHYEGKAMPSAGLLPFFQSFICTANNPCYQTVTEDEQSGTVGSFNQSALTRIVEDLERILSSNDINEIQVILQDVMLFQRFYQQIQSGQAQGLLTLGSLVINPNEAVRTVQSNETRQAILDLLNAQLNLQNLDLSTVNELLEDTGVCTIDAAAQRLNLTLEQAQFRNILCVNGTVSSIVNFTSDAIRDEVSEVFCNSSNPLATENVVTLLGILQRNFNMSALLSDLQSLLLSNTGQIPSVLTPAVLLELAELYEGVRNLQGFSGFSSLNDFRQLFGDFQDLQNMNINQSLCGRSSGTGVSYLGGIAAATNVNSNSNDNSNGTAGGSSGSANTTQDNGVSYGPDAPHCKAINKQLLSSNQVTRIAWRQISPLFNGKILFYPDTPAVREIIKDANRTFANAFRFVELAANFSTDYYDQLYNYLNNSDTIQVLRLLTGSCLCDEYESRARNMTNFNVNTSICHFLSGFLNNGQPDGYDWRNAINNTRDLAKQVYKIAGCFEFNKFVGYNDSEKMMNDGISLIENRRFWAALEFGVPTDPSEPLPTHVQYKIRMDTDNVDSTRRIMDKYWRPRPRGNVPIDTKYFSYGFIYIQDMIDHAIIDIQTKKDVSLGVYMQQMPYPCYVYDRFIFAISRSLPLFLTLAWVLSVAMICKSIVYEKERRLKEVMKMMGLSNGVHWVAWFINSFVMMFLTCVVLVFILKFGLVLENSDPSCVLLFLTAFAIATIMQCFLFSVFFSHANIAACVAGFLYFMLYLPYNLAAQWEDELTPGYKFLSCLSSSIAFGWGCSYMARFEEQSIGLQWSNINVSPIVDDQFNMLRCIMMMLFDALMYGIAMWYIEAVFPGQYGVARKFYFPFQKSYWCGTDHGEYNPDSELETKVDKSLNLEAEPKGRRLGVSVKNLKKVYSTGKKVAVDGLSISFYEGQITSFLGHNGAGKTTTMSILTGLFPPTSGTAYVQGYNILTEMDMVRKSLGMCPQHNVLFDNMTVEEHLWFFARLRGLESGKVNREMEQMIRDVGLPHKRKELSSSLSGGMKRKLSVAIAFVGDAKTVILDEPTAGVDPYARRTIWELLIKLKKERTIILSTHHMDEADVLGDRIAIISQGKLCCCGSSLYLKSQYGNGYYLTLVRKKDGEGDDDDDDDNDDVELDDDEKFGSTVSMDSRPSSVKSIRTVKEIEAGCTETDDEGYADSKSDSDPPTPPPEGSTMIPGFSVSRLEAFIQKHVRGASLVEDTMTEVTFQLPDDPDQMLKFERLFRELEKNHKDLGVSSFGVSDTSLEEVFLKVAEQTSEDDLPDEFKRKKLEDVTDGGRFARPVTRLSFRRKKKKSFLKYLAQRSKYGKAKIESEDLVTDTESIASEGSTSDLSQFNGLSKMDMDGFNHKSINRVKGKVLLLKQFTAMFIKRFHRLRRSKKGFFFEIILPALFVLLAMVFAEITPPQHEEPPLELHPWQYIPKLGDPHLYVFYSNDRPGSNTADSLTDMLLKSPGMGTRCMDSRIKTIENYPCPGSSSAWKNYYTIQPNQTIYSPECSCEKTGFQICPAGAGGPDPPMKLLPTSDYLYNMTGRNISDWLMKTNDQYKRRRYGGFSFGDTNALAQLNASQIRYILDTLSRAANNGTPILPGNESEWVATFEDLAVRNDAKVWYNNKGWMASVAYMNSLNNMILRSHISPSDRTKYGITTINHPMKLTKQQLNEELIQSSAIDLVIAICVIFAMSFIPASFTMVLIEERSSSSKHLQFVSGVNPAMYWFGNAAWDMLNYIVPCIFCIFIFLAFQREAFVGEKNIGCLIVLLILYGWAMIPMMYPFSRLFSVPSTAMVVLTSVNIFLGTTSTLAVFIVGILGQNDEELKNINLILQKVFLLLPQYCLGKGLIDMSTNQLEVDALALLGEKGNLKSPFQFDIVGRNLLAMVCLGVAFFVLNLLIEYNFFIKRGMQCFCQPKPNHRPLEEDDVDVAAERKRVLSGEDKNDVLRLENLTKVYSSFGRTGRNTAVDRLCVGVPAGQCFGLLGVNGAGKTTTFKMLTGDVGVTKGNAFLNNKSILTDLVQVRRELGYCPQFDAFDNMLTGREILCFYARLRGIPEKEVKIVSDWAIRKLGLLPYADRLSGSYSGGNKRKLSTAISLIGNPQVIFLDEPTTGMDPRARRFLWNCISAIVKDGRSVILTSHSMEECEALCGRLAIMVNGTFRCIGSIQHLKNRFGDGYTIIIRVAGENPDTQSVEDFVSETFPSAELREHHHNMLQYQLQSNIKLSHIFGQIERARERLQIEDYSVSQTTLDQVFINFAKEQTDMLDDEKDKESSKSKNGKGGNSNPTVLQIDGATLSVADEESLAGSTLELVKRNNSLSGFDSESLNTPYYGDEESLTGSQVELIRPGRSGSSSSDFPSVQIF